MLLFSGVCSLVPRSSNDSDPCIPNCEMDFWSPDVVKTRPKHAWVNQHVAIRPSCAPASRFIPPIRTRAALGGLLRSFNLTGNAVELGVQYGAFTTLLLDGWRSCNLYVQVDAWTPRSNYADNANRQTQRSHVRYRREAQRRARHAVKQGLARHVRQCANLTSVCAGDFPDNSFDFIYVDARHDYLGVLEDLSKWWPKLRVGGIMAGHDYTWQHEPSDAAASDPSRTGQDWTLNFDGSRDALGRAVKGAVDDFFGGISSSPFESPLKGCPRQVAVTYRENPWNTWVVAK